MFEFHEQVPPEWLWHRTFVLGKAPPRTLCGIYTMPKTTKRKAALAPHDQRCDLCYQIETWLLSASTRRTPVEECALEALAGLDGMPPRTPVPRTVRMALEAMRPHVEAVRAKEPWAGADGGLGANAPHTS